MFITRMRASASDDRSPWGNFWFEPVGRRTATGMRMTPDKAMHLPAVLACVRVLAESFSVLPLHVYQVSKNARKRLHKHWLKSLFRRPNKYQTGFEWREMMMGHLALRGNAYNEIQTDRQGNITALMPLHPDRVKLEWFDPGNPFGYRYRYTDGSGTEHVFAIGELWHLKGLSLDGIMGLSPISMAREAAALGLSAQEYGARFFENDAKPGGGWIQMPGTFKDKNTRDTFRESFQAAQTGINRHKIAVLENGMTFHELGLTNKDSQFLEARQFQVTEIARIFRVPPHLIGDLSKATFSNIEQQSLDFVIHTMTPWAERWESSMEVWLLLDSEDDIDPEFDFKGLLRGDQNARSAYYASGIQWGWKTRNEARADEGLEPLPGLDEPLRPLNMVEEGDDAAGRKPQGGKPPPANVPPPDDQSKAPEDEEAAASRRLRALLAGNAGRMARRIAGGQPPEAKTLAEALAISPAKAAAWLASRDEGLTETDYTTQLLELGA